MKYLNLWPLLFLSLSANFAEAHDGRSCLEQSAGLDQQERVIFLKGCLATAGSPDNEYVEAMKHELLRCEQNAKNLASVTRA